MTLCAVIASSRKLIKVIIRTRKCIKSISVAYSRLTSLLSSAFYYFRTPFNFFYISPFFSVFPSHYFHFMLFCRSKDRSSTKGNGEIFIVEI